MSNPEESDDALGECTHPACEGIDLVIKPRAKDLGDGFKVRRILPFHKRRMVGPFIFFDHFGPVTYAPGKGMDVRPHPHIGLSTVTYLFDGAIAHKDTVGSDLVIRPGAVNWMTAGKGIVHSERTPPTERRDGQKLHGIQTWVALPKTHETIDPDFVHHPADTLPLFLVDGVQINLLAGAAWGHASPVEFPWGILYVAIEAPAGATLELPASLSEERALYMVSGDAKIEGTTFSEGDMAVLTDGCSTSVSMLTDIRIMLAGGQAMDGPRRIEWNFVASDASLLDVAKSDWKNAPSEGWAGRFGMPDGEDEHIPLP